MQAKILAPAVIVALLSYALTRMVVRLALAKGLLDRPNARSLHSMPTPRGGGLSIVITTTLGVLFLLLTGSIDSSLASAVGGGGLVIGAVGFADDKRSLSAGLRVTIHLGAALWCMYVLGGLPPLQIGERLVDLGIVGNVLGTLAIVWTLNLFNFMDGIDGLAASEAAFVTLSDAFIGSGPAATPTDMSAPMLLGAGCLGFLVCNWPPAKIFMGDVGSGYIGYAVAALALAATRSGGTALFIWLILGGLFVSDATVTLIRRLARGEKVYQAHRSHAYQWLARRWCSHLPVTLVFWLINLVWLLPCAWWCARWPNLALQIVGVAYAPIVVLVTLAGAGRADRNEPTN